nr:transporter substrate-binding domain-containing protein [Bdellovibrio sp. HM001]
METLRIVAFMLMWVGAVSEASVKETVVKICYSSHAPYTYKENGAMRGIDVEMISLIFPKLSLKAEYHEMPWARCLLKIRSGGMDATTNAVKTAERGEFAIFSEPYVSVSPGLYVLWNRRDLQQIKGLDDFSKKSSLKVGVIRNAEYGPDFKTLSSKLRDKSEFIINTSDETNFKMLNLERIDIVLTMDHLASWEIDHQGIRNLVVRLNLKLAPAEYHILVSKKSKIKHLIPAINSRIGEMRRNGEYLKIERIYRERKVDPQLEKQTLNDGGNGF